MREKSYRNPRVITGDKQQASIKSGVEIPYQESSASGETTVSFKDAVLALFVTPNITPDDRIMLDLQVNQDSVGELVPTGDGGFIPSIDTTQWIPRFWSGMERLLYWAVCSRLRISSR